MRYRNIERFKYQLASDLTFETGITGFSYKGEFLELDPRGRMLIKDGYLADGPSGLTRDDETNMEPAFGHDGGYELIRRCVLPLEYKDTFDRLLRKWMLEKGALEIRANYYYDFVSKFGWDSCVPGSETKDDVMEV